MADNWDGDTYTDGVDYIIEFSDGSFFQNVDADHGGSLATAQRFGSVKEANAIMDKERWIALNGGVVIRGEEKQR
jgi:hypothetical protein